MSTRFGRVRELFHGLLDSPPAEREARLATLRSEEPALADAVGGLLRAHAAAGSFLDSPIVTHALTWSPEPRRESSPEGDLVGQVVGHYRLEQRLGTGGMGVVYRASDIALGRAAAVKFVSGPPTPDLQERLRAEAAACARLQHPAIATFYESGQAGGRTFIAMEYVPGPTLRAILADGALPVEQAVAVGASLLEALSHAHAVGVLHRDIKPENVIVTGDRSAKLLDFGIAALLLAADEATMPSVSQTIAGTIGYMSPEQIRNEPLDGRADLFQVGVVLYEMLAGRPAFPGAVASERLAAVLTADPAPIDRPDLGDALHKLIIRALAKDPAGRPPTAASFLAALRQIREGVTLELPNSLTVLPLTNEGEEEDDWIGAGVADTLAAELSRVHGLMVTRRERAAAAQRQARRVGLESRAVEIGAALGCRWILTGSYRRLGPALRVRAMLIEVSTGAVISNEPFDGTVDGIFALQDRISATVLARIAAADSNRASRPAPAVSAYEHFVRGTRLVAGGDRVAMQLGREHFEAAIALEPDYPEALVSIAQVLALSVTFSRDRTVLLTALDHLTRAIAADSRLAAAYVWRGYALMRLDRDDEAQVALARARELDPSDVFAYYFAGGPGWTGRVDTSIQLARQGLALQPRFGPLWWSLGSLYAATGRYDEALSSFARGAGLAGMPGSQPVIGIEAYTAECLRRMGRLDAARGECLRALEAVEASDFLFRDSIRMFALVTLGRIAADQTDESAALVALEQAIEHVGGRPRTMAGGTLWVRAKAVLASMTGDRAAYLAAVERFRLRNELDFSWLVMCDDYETCEILATTAERLGDEAAAGTFRSRARSLGPPAVAGLV